MPGRVEVPADGNEHRVVLRSEDLPGSLEYRALPSLQAAAYLIAKGYRIVARRFRTPVGEVDIVARRGRVLVFAEVKARDRLDDAAWSVLPRQQQRVVAAAGAWLAEHPDDVQCNIRFDALLVAPGRIPKHIEAAFEAG